LGDVFTARRTEPEVNEGEGDRQEIGKKGKTCEVLCIKYICRIRTED
jgi:hypothetical protein